MTPQELRDAIYHAMWQCLFYTNEHYMADPFFDGNIGGDGLVATPDPMHFNIAFFTDVSSGIICLLTVSTPIAEMPHYRDSTIRIVETVDFVAGSPFTLVYSHPHDHALVEEFLFLPTDIHWFHRIEMDDEVYALVEMIYTLHGLPAPAKPEYLTEPKLSQSEIDLVDEALRKGKHPDYIRLMKATFGDDYESFE